MFCNDLEIEVNMSHLCERRAFKYTRRTSNSTSFNNWAAPMDYLANEDATFRYRDLNSTGNATALYLEWRYRSMLAGFFECIPVIRANTSDSNSAFNSWNSGGVYTGMTSAQLATAMRFYNKAVNTAGVLNSHIPLKSFALKKDVAYIGYNYHSSGLSTTTSYGTDNTGGGIFMIPIADNR